MLRPRAGGGHAAKLEPGTLACDPEGTPVSHIHCRGVQCDQSLYYYLHLRSVVALSPPSVLAR